MFNKLVLIIVLLSLLLSASQVRSQSALTEVENFGSNPGNLQMFQYQPKGLQENIPLVVVLHGCIQKAEEIAQLTGWNKSKLA